MQQFYSAIACELEREGVWKYPSRFTNTDEVQYVRVVTDDSSSHAGYKSKDNNSLGGGSSRSNNSTATATPDSSTDHNVLIKFLPIYHFVDGR